MGIADTVPGVSGGTIAFISGIYEDLLRSISSFNSHLFILILRREFKKGWIYINGKFLFSLLSGIIIAIIALSRFIKWLLNNQAIMIWSFFFGLVIASVLLLARDIKQWNFKIICCAIGGAIIAIIIVSLPIGRGEHGLLFLFFAGALASCAMILPGISGAFILLLLGAYEQVLAAIHDFNIQILLVVATGAICGLILFSRTLNWLFNNHSQATISLMTGFVAGSLIKIWPWQINNSNVLPQTFGDQAQLLPALLLIFCGAIIVIILSQLKNKQQN